MLPSSQPGEIIPFCAMISTALWWSTDDKQKVGGLYHWKAIIASSFLLCYQCFSSLSVFNTRALVLSRFLEALWEVLHSLLK